MLADTSMELYGKGWLRPGSHRTLLVFSETLMPLKTNTATSPVMDSHPQDDFSADLSVFQAHLPWHNSIEIKSCRSLWFVYLSGREIGTIQILQRIMVDELLGRGFATGNRHFG